MHSSEQSTSHEQNPLFQEAGEATRIEQQALKPNTEYIIDPSIPMARDTRYGCDITAVITTDRAPAEGIDANNSPDAFVLVDIRKNEVIARGERKKVFGGYILDGDVDFLLIGQNMDSAMTTGFKGVRRGETIEMGRNNAKLNERFKLQPSTSRRHFALTYTEDGSLIIKDENSSNGTHVESTTPLREKLNHRWQSKEEQSEAFRPRPQAEREPINDFGLRPELRRDLKQLEDLFGQEVEKGEINPAMIAGIIKEVDNMRSNGLDDNKIYRQIARKIHPDKVEAGSAEHARMTALIKVVNVLLRNK